MAQTFTAYFPAVAFAVSKNMGALLNTHATELIKVRKVGLVNAQTAGVTGVLCNMELRRYTGGSLTGPTAVTPVSHDTTNTAPAALTAAHAGTIGGTPSTLAALNWSSDEAAVSSATSDELENFLPLNIVYEWQPHSDIQPITLRQNEMLMLFNAAGAAGLLHSYMVFTKE